jgi:hypothetical protein
MKYDFPLDPDCPEVAAYTEAFVRRSNDDGNERSGGILHTLPSSQLGRWLATIRFRLFRHLKSIAGEKLAGFSRLATVLSGDLRSDCRQRVKCKRCQEYGAANVAVVPS